jgi:hypothetical protein
MNMANGKWEAHSPINIIAPRTQPTHAATIQDINDALDGKIKAPIRVVSADNLAGIYDNTELTLTMGADGVLVIDGITLAAGNRLLLAGQLNAVQNGIYIVTYAGSASTPAVLTRAADFNESEKILSGVRINVDAGTLFGDTTWRLAAVGTIVLDTTALEFIKVSSTAGTAKYAETITGDGLKTEFNIEHDLATTDVSVSIRNLTTNAIVIVDWHPEDSNNIEINFGIAPPNTMSFRVVVIG